MEKEMAWFWKFDLLLKTFQGPPLPSCLFNECKFLSLTFHLHISARAPNQWLSVLAVHWNYLGKFTINWCLDLTPKSSDVISLGCIENLKISLSDSTPQLTLRNTAASFWPQRPFHTILCLSNRKTNRNQILITIILNSQENIFTKDI